jgi:hypothetical protein
VEKAGGPLDDVVLTYPGGRREARDEGEMPAAISIRQRTASHAIANPPVHSMMRM